MTTKQTGQGKDAGRRRKRLSRRSVRRARRPQWVCRLRSLSRVIASSRRMIDSTMHAFEQVAGRAERAPIRTSRDLQRLEACLRDASVRLERAVRRLGETTDSMLLEGGSLAGAPRLLTEATVRWLETAKALADSSSDLFTFHENLLEGVRSGELAPEAETPRRLPRIIAVPRLISARGFLLCRRSSALDRIATIPARRRRTACRATADAPRRISRGRAPPLFSNCLL